MGFNGGHTRYGVTMYLYNNNNNNYNNNNNNNNNLNNPILTGAGCLLTLKFIHIFI